MGSKIGTKLKIARRGQKTALEIHLGQILGPCWTKLGRKMDQVGAKLGQDGTKLGLAGAELALVGAKLGQVGATSDPGWTRWTNMTDKTAKLDQVGPEKRAKKHQIKAIRHGNHCAVIRIDKGPTSVVTRTSVYS